MKTANLRALAVAVSVVWCFLTATSQAEVKCPWLNSATASGVLGGEVAMNVKKATEPVNGKGSGAAMYPDQVRADRFDATCTFTRQQETGTSLLKIAVTTMADPSAEFAKLLTGCRGRKLPLRGIGNEAIQCVMEDSGHGGSGEQEQVIARVRDRSFVLTIHREGRTHPASAGGALSDETRNVAEQVAGSLF